MEIAQEFVEAVQGRQELVLVAEMVLGELPRFVTERLQELSDGRVLRLWTDVGAGHANLRQPRADGVLARDERRPAGCAALLAVVIGEGQSLIADSVDVGRAVAHLPAVVVADVPPADVVSSKNEDVRLVRLRHFALLPLEKNRLTSSTTADRADGEANDHASL